jgi:hypothetical protein
MRTRAGSQDLARLRFMAVNIGPPTAIPLMSTNSSTVFPNKLHGHFSGRSRTKTPATMSVFIGPFDEPCSGLLQRNGIAVIKLRNLSIL